TFTAKTSARIKPSPTSQLQLSGAYSLFRDQYVLDQRNSSALDKDEETKDQLLQLNGQYDHLLFSKHLVSVGTEAAFEQLQADRIVDNNQDRHRIAVFIQDDWAVMNSPNIGFVPGVRFDLDSRFGTKFTPKAAVRYDPVDDLAFKASYGVGFRAPDFKELALIFENPSRSYIVEGTPDLLPETSQGLNFSIEYSPSDVASMSVNLFRNEITDLISFALGETETTGIERYRYTNISSAMTQGGELSGKLRLWDALKINLGYSYTDSHDAENNRPLEGRSRHRLSSRVVYDVAPWNSSFAVNAVINGPAPYYVPTEEGTSAVYYPIRPESVPFGPLSALNSLIAGASEALVDIRFRTWIFEQFTIFVNINNILNSGEARFFAAPPLNVIGGLIAKL
ncbi:MAG: TonB-dependent receptor, partial [Myxococcota bacterium]|nr:TonB-dependent receptor [Myxococcota bacterium]